MSEEMNENLKEIDTLNSQIDKIRKENVIDRDSRSRKHHDNLRVNEVSRSRFSNNYSYSRVSEMEQIEN